MPKSEKELELILGSTGSGRKPLIKLGSERYTDRSWFHYGDRLLPYLNDDERELHKRGELIPPYAANQYFDEMINSTSSKKIIVSGFGINHEEMVHILTDYAVAKVFLLEPLENEQLSRLLDSMRTRPKELKRPLNVILGKILHFEQQKPLTLQMLTMVGVPVIRAQGTLENMFATIEKHI